MNNFVPLAPLWKIRLRDATHRRFTELFRANLRLTISKMIFNYLSKF
jgi:hypothetical protein